MNDSKNSIEEEMPAGVRHLIVVNHKYKKIICMGKLCERAIKAANLRKHLQGRHRIRISVARQASQVVYGFRWDEGLWANVQPKDGLAPQVGLGVMNGYQCTHCRQYMSIFREDIDDHWGYHGHGVTDGHNADMVRFQTWYGSFVDGYNNSYWVVDEEKEGESEETEEASMDEAPAEEDPSKQAPEEEMVEEMESKDIPVYISEESEDWSEEDGREEWEGCKEKEDLEGREGNCFRWKRGKAADEGWEEMAGDWDWVDMD
jgi:hypothetical protein